MNSRPLVRTCLAAALVVLPGCGAEVVGWTDWRGPNRHAVSTCVPQKLPAVPGFLWQHALRGVAFSGVAATSRYVVVADKDAKAAHDIWHCLDADTGRRAWSLMYPAAGEMEYTNSPRATPVIHQGLVYLFGAFGDLHCVRLATGNVVWKKNIVKDFGATVISWGMSATPLIVEDKLIVNPGAADAALIALDRRTGRVLWKTPGREAAYASFIVGSFGGVRQVVGYDSVSLGGWDVRTGRRLWELLPPEEGDFNVPTPINAGGRLVVATENNGTRLYGFDARGRILREPLAVNDELAPDTSTPVVLGDRVFGCSSELLCLDLARGLKTVWRGKDELFEDYASLIAGNGRVLITASTGELLLVDAAANRYRLISRLKCFEDDEVISHPALVGDRLYIRGRSGIHCLLLDERPDDR